MRHLTIQRNKTFVGCAGKVQICISDPASAIRILDTPVRTLCVLKNSESQVISVPDEEFTLFAAADALSLGYCLDQIVVPAGTEDVTISGQCRFNPFIGNPFRFDGSVPNEAIRAGQKKQIRNAVIGILVGLAVFFVIFGALLFFADGKPADFDVCGYRITLDKSFTIDEQSAEEASILSDDVTVYVTAIPAEMFEAYTGMSPEDLLSCCLDYSALDTHTDPVTVGNFTYIQAEYENNGYKLTSLITGQKDVNSFLIMEFTTLRSQFSKHMKTMLEQAQTAVPLS